MIVPKLSAGLLMYRRRDDRTEVLLGHPGGPFWTRKDLGAWSIPKGEINPGENPVDAARREFREETGFPPDGTLLPLGALKQPSGKLIHAWAFEGDCDPAAIKSETFSMEWPPRSGLNQQFPEIDRAAWFSVEEALKRILVGQRGFIHELMRILGPVPR
jgi:predicted NUDIX family NTP pyrophosphohydrolase